MQLPAIGLHIGAAGELVGLDAELMVQLALESEMNVIEYEGVGGVGENLWPHFGDAVEVVDVAVLGPETENENDAKFAGEMKRLGEKMTSLVQYDEDDYAAGYEIVFDEMLEFV